MAASDDEYLLAESLNGFRRYSEFAFAENNAG